MSEKRETTRKPASSGVPQRLKRSAQTALSTATDTSKTVKQRVRGHGERRRCLCVRTTRACRLC